jgi:hypothetical protein
VNVSANQPARYGVPSCISIVCVCNIVIPFSWTYGSCGLVAVSLQWVDACELVAR